MVLQLMSNPRKAGFVAGCLAVYGVMWAGWRLGWTWVTTPDDVALEAARGLGAGNSAWVPSWNVLCTVLSPVSFRLVTLVLIVVSLLRRPRQTRVALFLFVSVEVSAFVTEVAKRLAGRPRPATAMVDALGSSFPSGHALGTMVAALALGAVLAPQLSRRARSWAIAVGVLVIVAVGVGRVALNVHHPSDVLAGWALGYVYFVLCRPLLAGQGIGRNTGRAR